jgi:hypothetical protein
MQGSVEALPPRGAPVGRVLALVALSQVWRLSASQPAFLRGRGGS